MPFEEMNRQQLRQKARQLAKIIKQPVDKVLADMKREQEHLRELYQHLDGDEEAVVAAHAAELGLSVEDYKKQTAAK